ncbi:TatD family hydrolase [Enterovirga rhinocerotis]|uniref:TatD DNase family protein n=1 Tax=Enterovirga rhinocerotis TaxID=1339210 RepID=A0A4R7C7C5_9HYPH|nr:TatD family hydrolase [Enterovirga rhinocerotis]TDR94288.1 TatD DNase family protein [Enterovirga rhinocerotis]
MLIDSHCHLDFPDLAPRVPDLIARAAASGVGRMVTISTHVSRYETYRAIAEAHPEVLFTVGTHPHNAGEEPDVPASELEALSRHPRCIAIGEAGLDFHYDRAPRDVQERVFRTHIAAARATGLPLVIHAREADEVMIRVLQEEHGRGRFDAVLHCFSSTEALARAGIELGFYLSFSGILTFRGSTELRRIAAEIAPRERLLVETDAPYLAPVPHRGRTNEPAYVAETAKVLAETIGVTPAEAAALTTANFLRLFTKARPFVEAAAARSAA